MPLSRHLYSLDEVQAALLYTTTRNSPTEALFWCQELILSITIYLGKFRGFADKFPKWPRIKHVN